MDGWVKLWRKFMYWEWYTDVYVKSVFLHLLISANHDDGNWCGIAVKKGQIVTSLEHLSRQLNLSVQQVRTALNKLKSTSEITSTATNKYTIITICNYADYQSTEADNQQAEQQAEQQTSNKRATNEQQTNNNKQEYKECKKDRNIEKENIVKEKTLSRFTPPTIDEVAEYCRERNNTISAERFVSYYESVGWMVGRNKMKDWRKAVITWELKEKERTQGGQTQSNSPHTETDEQGRVFALWPDGFKARLGVGEFLENGERKYRKGGVSVPRNAEPRPSRDFFFNRESNTWTTA